MLATPKHIAIVMDGNGRWAQKKGLSRLEGHRAGVHSATDIVRYCGELKIPYLTLYAFSSENWNRPAGEVTGLMKILKDYLTKDAAELIDNGVKIQLIGSLERLPKGLQAALKAICHKTRNGDNLTLIIAISYGSRAEITLAAKALAEDIVSKKIKTSDITEDLFSQYLQTKDIPDPDLLIRTSGEMRLSNFLLWQISYSELHITPVLWPDFKRTHLDIALKEYAKRQRRFGGSQ